MMETRSLSDSKLPLAELEIEEEIAKKQSHSLKHSASGRPTKPPRAAGGGRSRGGSAALARYNVNDGNKRDSRTGEAIGSKMCQEHPERCNPIEFIESLAIQPDYVFKILVVGNSYVGKSSFLMRLCTNAFSQRYASTIGVDFYSKALEIDDKIISLQLWDTAGQERFQSVTKAYYRGAQGIVLVYDISQEESFISVKSWISTIQENVEEMPGAMMLVGNKVDLQESSEREVSTETGETFAKIYGAEFIETSAKTGYNVGTALLMLVRSIKSYYESRGSNAINSEYKKTVDLAEQESSGSKCCGR